MTLSITKMIAEKKRYRQFKARAATLPEPYHTAIEALERYFMYFGGMSDADLMMTMLDDLADLFETSAADRTPIRSIVGNDPVEFAETFIANYSGGQWIDKERTRLIRTIDSIAGDGEQ